MAGDGRTLKGAVLLCAFCTVIVTGLVVRRELFPAIPKPPPPRTIPASEWETLLRSGRRIGPANAGLTIVEFVDFECPACAAFARTVGRFRRAHPHDFAVIFHHYPLDIHSNALALARASECAAKQGKFEAFHDSVFARHREMVGLPPMAIATTVGVPDTVAFGLCVADTTQTAEVERGIAAGQRIGVTATPTVVVGGKVLVQLVDSVVLEGLLKTQRR